MKFAAALAGFLLLLAVACGVGNVRGDELIQIAPHRAGSGGVVHADAPPLLGFLARPDGPGRFPAVILLHGCVGFSDHDILAASTLKSWGYVGLALDSLGDTNMCLRVRAGAAAEVTDAYAALRYLATLKFVASDRVAIMGYSMGGGAALIAVDKIETRHPERPGFRAMVAYYPGCVFSSGIMTAPALILIGARDDWTPAAACRKLAARESDRGISRGAEAGTPIRLVVYPNATHAFDYRLPPGRYLGHFRRYDAFATRDAEKQVRAFLRQYLGGPPEHP